VLGAGEQLDGAQALGETGGDVAEDVACTQPSAPCSSAASTGSSPSGTSARPRRRRRSPRPGGALLGERGADVQARAAVRRRRRRVRGRRSSAPLALGESPASSAAAAS
jgi:hypothetical protein